MDFNITGKPEYSMLSVGLNPGDEIIAESGAMVSCDTSVNVKTSSRGGVLSGIKRATLGGESFFVNRYTTEEKSAEIKFAPPAPGDISYTKLDNQDFYIQSASFLAAESGIELNTSFQGLKGFFSGEGLFMLKASGNGHVFFDSYGAIEKISLDGTVGKYIVDTGHIVAFEPSLKYRIKTVGGLKATFFSGEGLVCEFSGSGDLYIQTRTPETLASWVHPFRKVKSENKNS